MIEVESQGDVAVLRMRHGKANAQSVEFCAALVEEIDQLAHTPARALVITGAGAMFSAGVDLLRVLDDGVDYLATLPAALARLFEAVFFHPKPVVAAINGHAIAGGCLLACAADRRLMARGDGRIGVPELLVGVPFPAIALEIARSACAPQHLQELVYSGVTLDADTARGWGLVHEVTEQAQLLDRAVASARALAALRGEAFAVTKRQLREPARERIRSLARHEEVVLDLWRRQDTVDAIDDYVSRTFKKR